MNVAFLGMSTEDKQFLILCLAKIISCHTKVRVLSKHPYTFDEINETYEYCGIEFILLKEGDDPLSKLSIEASNLIDAEEYINIPEDFKIIAISETTRVMLENCVKLAGEYTWFKPSINIYLVYLNIMEYCKIGKRYLDCFWERGLPRFTEIKEIYEIFFEEKNRIVMIESQYSKNLSIRKMSSPYRAALRNIIQDIFSMDINEAKALIKTAERMK
ncbi:MAG: hypothetical protein GX236_11870 [Clostridiaceae bacterium]|jgi:hypothetical protein|nr:hypothetical protein [Clostridiaceae bacterium]